MPKSVIIARPSRASRMLLGFTSRWTMPRTWATPEGSGDVEPDPGDLDRRERSRPRQARGHVLALDKVHDQERAGRVGAGVHAGDDVLVAQDRGGQGLAPEPVGEVAIGADLRTEQLQRDIPVEPGVARAVDRRHPAASDDRAQPVAARDEAVRSGRWSGRSVTRRR